MRIERGQLIAGLPAVKVRDFFRRAGPVVDARDVERRLGFRGRDAVEFLERLVEAALLWRRNDHPGEYEVTPHGTRLIATRVGTITRDQADELLHGIIDRADIVNADPAFRRRITKLVVFGSYLNERMNVLGDVDVAVYMERKPEASKETYEEAIEDYKRVAVFLKSRQRGISLHEPFHDQAILDRVRTLTFDFSTRQMIEKDGPVS